MFKNEKEENPSPNFFETAPELADRSINKKETVLEEEAEKIFSLEDIKEDYFYKKAHQDGITWIEVIPT